MIKDTILVDSVYTLRTKYYLENNLVRLSSFSLKNGQILSESNYKNGQSHGIQREWSEDGQLLYQATMINGQIQNNMRYWYETGELKFEGYFIEGKGLVIGYDKKGKVISVEEQDSQESLVGLCQYWFDDGGIRYIRDYGLEVQPYREYYNNGQISVSAFLLNGVTPCGEWFYWTESGSHLEKKNYSPCP